MRPPSRAKAQWRRYVAAVEPDVDAIVARLRERVEERRKAGAYPPGLEDELAAHFRRIAQYRTEPNVDAVRAALGDLEKHTRFSVDRIPIESGLPGGERLHRALAKVQARQIEGVLRQVSEYTAAVRAVLEALTDAVEDPNSHVHPDLLGQLDATLERLTAYERGGDVDSDRAGTVAELRRRIDRLEQAEARRGFRPFFSMAEMVDAVGGPIADSEVAARLTNAQPVLELWCGRGDFLAALRTAGIDASGVEVDDSLAAAARARGLQVEVDDPVRALAAAPDGSLGGLALIHVVEHMMSQDVADVALLAVDKVRAGGVVVCQTVPARAVSTMASPTPVHPLDPSYLSFLFARAGFAHLDIAHPSEAAYVLTATR
jgi:hypothetical protein